MIRDTPPRHPYGYINGGEEVFRRPAPPHLHVTGSGSETRIGQNGKPLQGDAELAPVQQRVVETNIGRIRRAVHKIGRYYWFNER